MTDKKYRETSRAFAAEPTLEQYTKQWREDQRAGIEKLVISDFRSGPSLMPNYLTDHKDFDKNTEVIYAQQIPTTIANLTDTVGIDCHCIMLPGGISSRSLLEDNELWSTLDSYGKDQLGKAVVFHNKWPVGSPAIAAPYTLKSGEYVRKRLSEKGVKFIINDAFPPIKDPQNRARYHRPYENGNYVEDIKRLLSEGKQFILDEDLAERTHPNFL